jgi:MFS transporter, ACS family, hexuronate transporter
MNDNIPTKRPIKHLRWYIIILLCLASQLNYLDRQTFSVLAGTIQKDLSLSDRDYALLMTTFVWTYALAYLFSGYVVDWLGSRRSFLTFVTGWSVANMLHAFAGGLGSLAVCRGLLALMEPANFPAGIKAVSEWFPVRERALAVGIFNTGTNIGLALAAPLSAFLALHYGWRSAFIFTGALGLVWVVAGALFYRTPQEHSRLGGEERALIEKGREAENAAAKEKVSVSQILRIRAVWGCMLVRLITDPATYFLLLWIPKYLEAERGFDLKQAGMFAWIPYAAMTVGSLLGGALPQYLTARGWTVNRARKTTMFGISCGMVLFCYLVTKASTPGWAVAMLAVVMLGHAAWGNMTLPAEVLPKHIVGTVTGFGGFLGGIAGGAAQLGIGSIVMQYGYGPIFAVCSVIYLVALAVVHWVIGELGVIRNIPAPPRLVRHRPMP